MSRKISVTDKTLLTTKYMKHVLRRVIFNNRAKSFEMNSDVIILPPGGLILSYFKDSEGQWKIVLVGQYRPAVGKKILEAPGGRLDSESPKIALARELMEEADIKVKPQSIRIVVNEYTHPSILNACFIGGIVRIGQKAVKNKIKAGNAFENERTQVKVFNLVEIIKKREANLITLDLMTSRLIDEVAKTVGLLIRQY